MNKGDQEGGKTEFLKPPKNTVEVFQEAWKLFLEDDLLKKSLAEGVQSLSHKKSNINVDVL